MLILLIVAIALVLLFGGLGLFVAKAFLAVALVALLAGLLAGGLNLRGHRH
jgi:hypothetical protein